MILDLAGILIIRIAGIWQWKHGEGENGEWRIENGEWRMEVKYCKDFQNLSDLENLPSI